MSVSVVSSWAVSASSFVAMMGSVGSSFEERTSCNTCSAGLLDIDIRLISDRDNGEPTRGVNFFPSPGWEEKPVHLFNSL